MSTGSVQTTAQIIQFPAGGRKALTARQVAPLTDLETQAAGVFAGDAWYHQAAIDDSKRIGGR